MNAGGAGYLVHPDPNRQFVEAWSTWHLPFMNLTRAQSQYRAELRTAIAGLNANGILQATYTSQHVVRGAPDLENVLFYNVGTSLFRQLGKNALCFVKRNAATPVPPAAVNFTPLHHARYEVAGPETSPPNQDAAAAWAHVTFRDEKELKNLAGLWRSFKEAMVSAPETGLTNHPLSIRMVLSVPQCHRINLAEAMKPLTDAFMSALHYYQGNQLEAVVARLSQRLECSPESVRELLFQTRAAVLGPRAVPHLRGEGLQWSPADDLLTVGEFVCETSARGLTSVSGQVSRVVEREC